MTYKQYLAAFEQQGNQATPNLIAGVMPPLVLEIDGDPAQYPGLFIDALMNAFEAQDSEDALYKLYKSGITQIVLKCIEEGVPVQAIFNSTNITIAVDNDNKTADSAAIVFGDGASHGFIYEL